MTREYPQLSLLSRMDVGTPEKRQICGLAGKLGADDENALRMRQ